MFQVVVVNRKYAQAILTSLRDKSTGQIEFRKGLVRLGRILGLEIVEDLETEDIVVETPLGVQTKGIRIKDLDKVIIVTILRAAWPLTEGLIKILYNAKQGVAVARRAEERGMKDGWFDIDVHYLKTPGISEDNIIILSDVMVATGSTVVQILRKLMEEGRARRYYLASVITTPIAITRMRKLSEELGIDLKVYAIAIDPEVNEHGYIVPGLGDAGDRSFGS